MKEDEEIEKDEVKPSAEIPRSIESHFNFSNCTVTLSYK